MPEQDRGKEAGAAGGERDEARKPVRGDDAAVSQEESLKVHGDKYEGLIPGAEKKPTEK